MRRALLLPFACLGLLLSAACASLNRPAAPQPAVRPTVTLPPELRGQDEKIQARVQAQKRELRRGKKITDPNEACFYYFYGALSGDEELLGLLQKNGVDINARNTLTRVTPLYLAVQEGTPQSAAALIERGADIQTADPRGRTVLYEAVCADNTTVTRKLLERGADPNIREREFGTTALLSAAMDGRTEIVRLLLEHGANPNLGKQAGGATALHLAILKNHADVVRLLLEHKADPNTRTKAGTTPLQTALNNNLPQLAGLLKQYGAQ